MGLRTADFSRCVEQRFTCSLNATSRTCGLELGPVQPSVGYINVLALPLE